MRIISVLLALCGVGFAQQAGPAPARRALLVGINNYKHADGKDFLNLNGAAGDADWLKTILVSKFGFEDANVIVLKDSDATRAKIIKTFQTHLIAKSKQGDLALFYFAGHGTQRLTAPYRIPPAKLIETAILPYDARDPGVFDIAESELHTLFADLVRETTNVTSILDSCFSAIAVRGDSPIRSAPPDIRERPADSFVASLYPAETNAVQTRGIEAAANPVDKVVRISAAGATQLSNEYSQIPADGKPIPHGALSYYLFNALEAATQTTTWRDVMGPTRVQVSLNYSSQMPEIQAPNEDDLLFGGLGPKAREVFFTAEREGRNVKLNAGSIHSITAGTQLDVYGPTEIDFTGAPNARISVTTVNGATSSAELLTGSIGQVKPGSRAVIRFRPPSAFQFRIFFEGSDSLISSVQKDALAIPDAVAANTRQTADAVVRLADGALRIEHSDRSTMSDPIPTAGGAAGEMAVKELQKWIDWRRNLNNPGDPGALKLKLLDLRGKPLPAAIQSDTRFRLWVCNTGKTPYFARIYLFASDGTAQEFQGNLYGKPIEPASGCEKASGELTIAPPGKRRSGIEYIKVYATAEPVDLDFLNMAQTRGDAGWSSDKAALHVTRK